MERSLRTDMRGGNQTQITRQIYSRIKFGATFLPGKENLKFRNLKFLKVGAGRMETEHLDLCSVLNWFLPLADGIAIELI